MILKMFDFGLKVNLEVGIKRSESPSQARPGQGENPPRKHGRVRASVRVRIFRVQVQVL